MWCCLCDPTFCRFSRTLACDRRTQTQTDTGPWLVPRDCTGTSVVYIGRFWSSDIPYWLRIFLAPDCAGGVHNTPPGLLVSWGRGYPSHSPPQNKLIPGIIWCVSRDYGSTLACQIWPWSANGSIKRDKICQNSSILTGCTFCRARE